MRIPCAMTIAGSDSGGGAGIQADVKTFATLGVHGLVVITAVTAQNTKRVAGVMEMPPAFVANQIDTLVEDFDVSFAKTGMLGSADIIRTVGACARQHDIKLIVDPVMVSATGSPLMRENGPLAIRELLARTELVTPNAPEAEVLSGLKVRKISDMRKAAKKIAKLGPKAVLIKGGHVNGKTVTDVFYSNGKFTEFSGPRLTTDRTHGTGCSLSSAITAELAKGADLRAAIIRAKSFLASAIQNRLKVGSGIMPVNQMAALLRQAETGRAVAEVWRAANLLVESQKFSKLIPEVGVNVVMALPGARQKSEVVGLSGRIVKSGGRAVITGFPELGGSGHVATVVLAAIGHDPSIRSAMNIRHSRENLHACRGLGLTLGFFDRRKEPKGTSTMEWGADYAIKRLGKVPDAIFDNGGIGKEAMIRLLGKTPKEVAELALRIARKIS